MLTVGLGILRHRAGALAATIALVYLPLAAFTALLAAGSFGPAEDRVALWIVVDRFYACVVAPLAIAVGVGLALDGLSRRRGPPRPAAPVVRAALARSPGVIGVCLATVIAIAFAIIIVSLPTQLILPVVVGEEHLHAVGLAIGAVTALLVLSSLWLAPAVVLAEGLRPGDALARSSSLVRGRARAVLVVVLCLHGGKLALEAAGGLWLAAPASDAVVDKVHLYLWTSLGLGALVTMASAVASAVAYHQLRAWREGAPAWAEDFE